jgi:hypothetical protein
VLVDGLSVDESTTLEVMAGGGGGETCAGF